MESFLYCLSSSCNLKKSCFSKQGSRQNVTCAKFVIEYVYTTNVQGRSLLEFQIIRSSKQGSRQNVTCAKLVLEYTTNVQGRSLLELQIIRSSKQGSRQNVACAKFVIESPGTFTLRASNYLFIKTGIKKNCHMC